MKFEDVKKLCHKWLDSAVETNSIQEGLAQEIMSAISEDKEKLEEYCEEVMSQRDRLRADIIELHAELEKLKKGMSEKKLADIIQLRYFKLMHPDIDERGAKIVADTLAESLRTHLLGEEE